MPAVFSVDISKLVNLEGLLFIALIIITILIIGVYKYLQTQSELAKINRECITKISELESKLGKYQESYDRVFKELYDSQKKNNDLQSFIMNFLNKKN